MTSAEVGYRKPDPRGYLELCQRLQVQPGQMLFVGNEEKDISGANAAGLFSVLVDREGHSRDYGERLRISALNRILPLMQQAINNAASGDMEGATDGACV